MTQHLLITYLRHWATLCEKTARSLESSRLCITCQTPFDASDIRQRHCSPRCRNRASQRAFRSRRR